MKQNIHKTIIVVFTLLLLLPACGYKDIDKRFFAVAIGIDFNKDNEKMPYIITLALAVPSTKIEPKSAITQIESIEAANISDGLRQLKSKLDKELDLGHCKIIVIGEELANQDITDVIYWGARRRDLQNIAAIAIGSPTAAEIVSVQPESDRFPGNTISFFFSGDTTESTYTYTTTLTDIFKRILEPGLDPILPIIKSEDDSTFKIDTIALLDKQKVKLVLEPKETQLYNQLSQHLTRMSVYGSYLAEGVTLAITKIKSTYIIDEYAAEPTISLSVKQQVVMEEISSEMKDKSDPQYQNIMKELEQKYCEETKALFEKIQAEEIDPYGFGLRYRAKHPLSIEQFDEIWPPLYKEITFNINTKIDLTSTGLLK